MKHKKLITALGLVILICFASFGFAQTFNLIFNVEKYEPKKYSWQEPWTVQQVVDFIQSTLIVNGSGYEGEVHDYVLTLKNVAPDVQLYILSSMNYGVFWQVGAVNETIVSGSYSGILKVGENITYTGTFEPSIYGEGNIVMNINNIVWIEAQPITWTANVVNTFPEYVTVTSFTIEGAGYTYIEAGTAVAIFSGPSMYVYFDVTIPEHGTQSFRRLVSEEFRLDFSALTSGGAKTTTLTVTGAGSNP